jgi:4-hydroxy-2-oxoheptanedioate aldolase
LNVKWRSSMADDKLKERWKAGKAGLNGWLAIPSGFSAEVTAQYGWIA